MKIRIRLLGDCNVYSNSDLIRLNKKERALLAYLASSSGKFVGRAALVELLWPGASEAHGRHSLSQALYVINRKVSPLVNASSDLLCLIQSAAEVDLQILRQALVTQNLSRVEDLYADFTDGLVIPGAPFFERWQEKTRTRLRRQVVQLVRSRCEILVERGEWEKILSIGNDISSLDPYDEQILAARLTALAATGRTGDLRLETLLAERRYTEELGRPLPLHLSSLQERASKETTAECTADVFSAAPFIGRGSEFQQLRSVWQEACQSGLRTVLVLGNPGVGKTRITERLGRFTAIRGARTFSAKCHSAQSHVPYSTLSEVFKSIDSSDLNILTPFWQEVAGYLLPKALQEAPMFREAVPALEKEGAKLRLFEGLSILVASIAKTQPVAIYIDDANWMDDASGTLLAYLIARCKDTKLLIVLTSRWDQVEQNSLLANLLSEAPREHLSTLSLLPLSASDAHEVVVAIADQGDQEISPHERQQVVELSGRNPFLIVEMSQALLSGREGSGDAWRSFQVEERIPISKAAVRFLNRRISPLCESSRLVLTALAIAGDSCTISFLEEVLHLSGQRLATIIGQLIDRGIVKTSGGAVEFTHSLFLEVVYRDTTSPQRQFLHSTIARLLQKKEGASLGRLAWHFSEAAEPHLAHTYAVKAAAETRSLHVGTETEYYLKLAIGNATSDSEEYSARRSLAEEYCLHRRYHEAENALQILERYSFAREMPEQIIINSWRLEVAQRLGSWETNVLEERLDNNLTQALKNNIREATSRILATAARFHHHKGNSHKVGELLREMVTHAERSPGTVYASQDLTMAANLAIWYTGLTTGVNLAEQAVLAAKKVDDITCRIDSLSVRGICYYSALLLSEAESSIQSALDLVNSSGALFLKPKIMNNYGILLLERGEFAAALRCLCEVATLSEQLGVRAELVLAHINSAVVEYELGNIEAAREHCELFEEVAGNDFSWCALGAIGVLGLCDLEQGRRRSAEARGDEVLRFLDGRSLLPGDPTYCFSLLTRLDCGPRDNAKVLRLLEQAIATYNDRSIPIRWALQLELCRATVLQKRSADRESVVRMRNLAAEAGAGLIVSKADRLLPRLEEREHGD